MACDSISTGICAAKLDLRHKSGVPFALVTVTFDPAVAELKVLTNDEAVQSQGFVYEMAKRAHTVAAINAGFLTKTEHWDWSFRMATG